MREENRKSERVIVGCMTGTSLDGLDLARVRVLGNGLQMSWRCEGTFSLPFGDLGQRLRRIASGQPVPAAEFTSAAAQLAELHADALRDFLDGRQADLICVHGQTVFHVPPLSLQLLQPASIAHRLKTPVVFDLRAADLAAGGQGAPITPIADFVLFRSQHRRAIVNLGGFANFTLLPATTGAENAEQLLNQIDGGDICACN
ncbi:MAG: anhydro-N-acetylmuramic acid kinase, partial [Phycisphaerae bacterium]